MKILYFAWLRAKTGIAEEELPLPPGVATVGALIEHLRTLSPGHAEAFADLSVVRAAVNQDFAELDQAVQGGDEVALFPPVTGG